MVVVVVGGGEGSEKRTYLAATCFQAWRSSGGNATRRASKDVLMLPLRPHHSHAHTVLALVIASQTVETT